MKALKIQPTNFFKPPPIGRSTFVEKAAQRRERELAREAAQRQKAREEHRKRMAILGIADESMRKLAAEVGGDGVPSAKDFIRGACYVAGISGYSREPVTHTEFAGDRRRNEFCLARLLAYSLLREYSKLSLPHIAKVCGRPNHSSVITALSKWQGIKDKPARDVFRTYIVTKLTMSELRDAAATKAREYMNESNSHRDGTASLGHQHDRGHGPQNGIHRGHVDQPADAAKVPA